MLGFVNHVLLEVSPIRIQSSDKADLPRTRPMFDVLLALDGRTDIVMLLRVYEALQPILLGKTVGDAFAMLPCPTRKIAGDAHI